jgi:two-component system LytT family response regulator
MNKLRAVIVDDEQNARENLSILLSEHCPNVEVIGQADNVSAAVEEVRQKVPDILFLDIEIGEGSGFDVLEKISGGATEVIFTTAFNHYAVKAFKFSAVDYLLKPIDIDELALAISRAEARIKQSQINQRLENLMNNLSGQDRKMKKIGLPGQGGIQYFLLSEIIRLQSQSNYTTFYLTQGREILVSKTLKEYDEMLADQGFVRVHQSHVINLEQVSQYQKSDGGYVILTDGSNVPLSKSYKENFLNALGNI